MLRKLLGTLSRKTIIVLACVLLVGGFAPFAFTQTHSAHAQSGCPATVGYGSKGETVRKLQTALMNQDRAPIAVDGVFGSQTKAAVVTHQKKHHLKVDGVAGPQTWLSLGFCSPF